MIADRHAYTHAYILRGMIGDRHSQNQVGEHKMRRGMIADRPSQKESIAKSALTRA
jgi:hypothetical protein